MLSTFSGLNTMVSGIQNNRVGLNTVGHNISNSSTEGYSRQQVNSVATFSKFPLEPFSPRGRTYHGPLSDFEISGYQGYLPFEEVTIP